MVRWGRKGGKARQRKVGTGGKRHTVKHAAEAGLSVGAARVAFGVTIIVEWSCACWLRRLCGVGPVNTQATADRHMTAVA